MGTSFCHWFSGKVYYGISIHISEFIIYYIKGWLCWTSQSPDYNCPFNLLRIPHNTNPWSLSLSRPPPLSPQQCAKRPQIGEHVRRGAFGELISLIWSKFLGHSWVIETPQERSHTQVHAQKVDYFTVYISSNLATFIQHTAYTVKSNQIKTNWGQIIPQYPMHIIDYTTLVSWDKGLFEVSPRREDDRTYLDNCICTLKNILDWRNKNQGWH